MERAERIGLAVSGGAHAALILWVAVGDWLFSAPAPQDVQIAEVAMISGAEFDALVAATAAAPRSSPAAPAAPAPPETAAPAPPPPAPEEAARVPPPPAPPEEAAPDDAPEVIALAPPQAEVQDAPPNPILAPVIEPSEQRLPDISPRPRERPAPRVAPVPADAPAPDAAPAPDTLAATRPETAADPVESPPEETRAAAPQEAGTVIETEENRTEEVVEAASAAPQTSLRPRSRPDRRETPAPETPETAAPAPPAAEAAEPEDAIAAAVAAAVAESATEGSGGAGTAALGPPLTAGERDALIVAVKQCWNLGALSSDALRTVVTVGVRMTPDGFPEDIRLISAEGGTDAATAQAYEAGRRAVLRCGARGFPLPPEKYDHWKEIEIVFNPEDMRLR